MLDNTTTDDHATLRSWVGSLDEDGLVRLLRARPDLAWGAPPADLADLAERLAHPTHIAAAFHQLDLPSTMVLDLVVSLGWGADVEHLTRFIRVAGAPDETGGHVVRILTQLIACGLVVPRPEGGVVAVPGLERVVPPSLGAAPLRVVLGATPVDQMVKALRSHRVQLPSKARAGVVTALRARLSDHHVVQQIALRAGDDMEGALHRLARRRVKGGAAGLVRWEDETAVRQWAADAGLVITTEVLLATLEGNLYVDLPACPPAVATTEVDPEVLLRASAGSLVDALAVAMGALEHLARTPLPLRQDGELGAREVTRLAKTLGGDVRLVRWALESARARGLLVRTRRHLTAGAEFDAWRRTDPGARCADLLQEWLRLDTVIVRDSDVYGVAAARSGLLTELAHLPPGRGATSTAEVLCAGAWRRPSVLDVEDDSDVAADVVAEAELLGVVASGSLTPVGTALVHGHREALVGAAAAALPDVSKTAVFASDLTVFVAGTPDADVVDLLDAVAEREARGAANSWRLTTASLREALDAGHDPADVLTRLRDVAAAPLPQPVEYFVTDVGRRYGRVVVRRAGTVLVGEEALIAELLADSGLRQLRLQAVAPTVLVSAEEPPAVLQLVRRAGYLPRAEDVDDLPAVSSMVQLLRHVDALPARVSVPVPAARPPAAPSTTALALRLLAGSPPADDERVGHLVVALRSVTPRLTASERRQLAYAVVHSQPLQLIHRGRHGEEACRVAELHVVGPRLAGRVRGARAQFTTDLVVQVSPVVP